ncbi:short chain dehydrogenase [Rhodocytophaga rosea]|uniref:Short chain dehydrogenase n=1 Tax=Rhodocytophaga rosea TaxID=2704465 RepID=A0A6C0GPA9_9BACT|nr:short chain dehydrogenase [Rhodocytophaga rosea]QHT69886.1 short chain dehydrogenase [Rhodocytophaga rosea]
MKIILVGATGTIGRKLYDELSPRYEVIKASANRGDVKVDITSTDSIRKMYQQVGSFDAMVITAGSGYIGPFEQTTEEHFYRGIRSKMMGQINLVMIGKDYINDNGSFTITSGILADEPIKGAVVLNTINSALHGFVMGATVELKRGIRLNVISPGMVEDSLEELGPFFPGHIPVPMDKVVKAYLKSVEGVINGQVLRVY